MQMHCKQLQHLTVDTKGKAPCMAEQIAM